MAEQKPFLVPVVVDGTGDQEAFVPDAFRAVQWTRLPGGETPPALVERIKRLLSPELSPLSAVSGATPAVRETVRASRRSKSVLFAIVAVVVCVATAYLVADRFRFSRHPDASAGNTVSRGTAEPAAASFAPPAHSIAVLPFVDLSEKHDQEYFADGMTEEVIDLLSRVPDLRVPARTSSFYFKGRQATVRDVARDLSVAYVLEGSVRKSADRIRVTAQLARADDGYHIWSQTYDRDLKDVFKVQDEIAAAVIEALKARLSTQRFVNQQRTGSLDAYTEYLRGNQFSARDTKDSNQQALAAYRRAVALDPAFAAAYSALAVSEWRVADQTTGETVAYERAKAAAYRAIALAPDSPDGYWARGTLRYLNAFDWSGAQSDFEKALSLDAHDVRTLVNYGRLMATLGRIPEAVAMTRKALELDPLSVDAWDWLGYYFVSSGNLSAAREAVRHVATREDNDTGWLVALLADGPRRALAVVPKDVRQNALYRAAVTEHALGHADASQRALDELIRDYAEGWAYQIALVYAWRGEADKAIEWLDRAYRQQDAGLTRLTLDPFFSALHGDPRFRALVRRMNLTD